MADSAYGSARGAEISERSSELVLPEIPLPSGRSAGGFESLPGQLKKKREAARERRVGLSNPEANYGQRLGGRQSLSSDQTQPAADAAPLNEQRGQALPGDRGRQNSTSTKQRPSFWRRISLGRRGAKEKTNDVTEPNPGQTMVESAASATAAIRSPASSETIEKRIVEPLLQALVSVESKLERSHVELIGRSDQVEQRLTQLWDIEEQLGSLGEIQEALTHVSEQQRRLEFAIVSQNRTLRWLVGAIFFAVASAAFAIAATLQ